MRTFRDAVQGVWCISWHPDSDDLRFESLASVLANNRVAFPGQHKGVLWVFGHDLADMMALVDDGGADHHGMRVSQACSLYRTFRAQGLTPQWFPMAAESDERWRWLVEG